MFIETLNNKQLAVITRASDDLRAIGLAVDETGAAKAIERTIAALLELGASLGLEPQELLFGKPCVDCDREAIEYRRVGADGDVVCNVCVRERTLERAAHSGRSEERREPARRGLSADTVSKIRHQVLGVPAAAAAATRASTLADANAAVVDRADRYGTPVAAFGAIAHFWSGIVNAPITAVDVALMLAAMKLVRARNNPRHADSWTDLAGYAACGAEVARAAKGEAA